MSIKVGEAGGMVVMEGLGVELLTNWMGISEASVVALAFD